MTSAIDATQPTTGQIPASSAALRNNFAAAKAEISALQALAVSLPLQSGYIVGCYYFPGWSTPGGGPNPSNPWSLITTYDATRVPLLGTYDETQQSINDVHFSWMKSYGIDFVAIDWFMQWSGSTLLPMLDHVVAAFKNSTARKPKFCLQFANQTNAAGLNGTTWATVYSKWITDYFSDPNYYTVNGWPVVIVNSVPSFKTSIGTNAQVKSALDSARAAAAAAGFGGIWFMGGQANSQSAWTSVSTPAVEGWDGITGSNIYTTTKDDGVTLGPSATTYADLHNAVFQPMTSHYVGFVQGWLAAAGINVVWPPLTVGFDNTPWNGGSTTLHGMPTLAEWAAHLSAAKSVVDANPTKTQRTIMIEAWNEFGEGSILEPTVGNGGFDRLRLIRALLSA